MSREEKVAMLEGYLKQLRMEENKSRKRLTSSKRRNNRDKLNSNS